MESKLQIMELIPGDDEFETQRTADGVLKLLRLSLQLLAAPAQYQLRHFPANFVVLTDEMALDFGNWAGCIQTYWKLSEEHKAVLATLDGFLLKMSGSLNADFWTDEALSSDLRWEEVRNLAKAALVSFGWPAIVPLLARYQNGFLIDGE